MSELFRDNEHIIRSLPSGIIVLNADGRIITANQPACAYLGVNEYDLQPGRSFASVASTEQMLEVFREVRDSHETVARREVVLTFPGGIEKEIGLSASPLQGDAAFNGVIFLFTDLTERRRLERIAELNQQLASLGELTAGVVHELRNPVSVISGMAELILRKSGEDDERRGPAEAILREANALERTIAQFLGLARPVAIERERCQPGAIAERAIELCERRAKRKQVQLASEFGEGLPPLYLDGERMAQALANIIGNGIDEVAEKTGRVMLRTCMDQGALVFEVHDNGGGIHVDPEQDLFKPFYTQKEAGTGLGLTIAHRTVAAHGGTIRYHNLDDGGACFVVRVPLESD